MIKEIGRLALNFVLAIEIDAILFLLKQMVFKNEKVNRSIILAGFVMQIIMAVLGAKMKFEVGVYFLIVISIAVFFAVHKKVIEKAKCTLILIMLTLLGDQLASMFFSITSLYLSEKLYLQQIQSESLLLAVLILLYFINKNKSGHMSIPTENKNNIVIVALMMIGIFVFSLISLCEYSKKIVDNDRYDRMVNVLSVVAFLAIIILIFIVCYVASTNKHIIYLLETQKLHNDIQEVYYKTLLDKENETRRFRHDIKAHMLSIREMADKSGDEELKQYIGNVWEELDKEVAIIYHTGNEIVDMMVNFYLTDLNDKINIKIDGFWKDTIILNKNEICIIFSNLMKNVVNELSDDNAGFVKIYLRQGRKYCSVEVINSHSSNGKKEWKDDDKINHGFGLSNIERIVKKYSGQINIEDTDDYFRIKIII